MTDWKAVRRAVKQRDAEALRKAVQAAIESGCDLDLPDWKDYHTYDMPLISLAAHCDPVSVRLLLRAGADVNVTDNLGHPPVFHAAMSSPECLSILLKAGADPNAKLSQNASTPLIMAAGADPKSVKILLAAGADPDLKIQYGFSPLMIAAEHNLKSVKYLIDAGADINAQDECGSTALKSAVNFAPHSRACALYLISAGADVNISDEYGATPLHEAVLHDWHLVEPLLAAGADPDIRDDAGETPLIWAVKSLCFQSIKSAELLIQAGADIFATRSDGRVAAGIVNDYINDSTSRSAIKKRSRPLLALLQKEMKLRIAAERTEAQKRGTHINA